MYLSHESKTYIVLDFAKWFIRITNATVVSLFLLQPSFACNSVFCFKMGKKLCTHYSPPHFSVITITYSCNNDKKIFRLRSCACFQQDFYKWFLVFGYNSDLWKLEWTLLLNLFRMVGGKKATLPVFLLQLLQMRELAPKTFWLLVSTLLPHIPRIPRPNLVPIPNYWTWTKSTPPKR